nr:WPE palindromic element domain-containing protein [Wolbachia endosymbiont of Oedothorax gibbosus]
MSFLCYFQHLWGVIPVPRHWDPENLIMYYTTFSIKSWIPVSSTGMTSQGHWNFYSVFVH